MTAAPSSRRRLVEMLRRYDDETWTALANRGLLRRARKDLTVVEVRITRDTAAEVSIGVGDRTVVLPLSGPADATCSCPSPVLCQHVLTAGLWLAAEVAAEPSGGPGETPADQPSGEQPTRGSIGGTDLHGELMALDAAALTSYAGIVGLRWAHQFLADLDEPPWVEHGDYLTVRVSRPELVARYLGGGLDAVLLDPAPQRPERYRVAMVLAWQAAHGRPSPPPAAPTSRPTATSLAKEESRARLRSAAAALLTDTVQVGVSHLSPAHQDRFTTAAVWAQGAEYPRLAQLLRRLADQVDLQLARSAAADDHLLLDEVAVAFGLVSALGFAALRGDAPPALVGQARASYDPIRSLDLVGLGGSPWRAASGYHGLTCVFWSRGRGRMLTWTDARPEALRGFDPRARWTQPAPWTGLSTPAVTAGRFVTLTSAQVSADSRLSGAARTSAVVMPTDSDDLIPALVASTSWSELATAHGGRRRSLLAAPDAARAWVVLRPHEFGTPHFDESRQTLVWPVLDASGSAIEMEVAWSRLHAHAISRIETLDDLPLGTLLVARLHRARGRLVGAPVSLVRPGRELNPVDCLHFDPPARGPAVSAIVSRLMSAGVPDVEPAAPEARGTDAAMPLPRALVELRSCLERAAERGADGGGDAALHDELAARHAALRDAGWPVFTHPDPGVSPAELLLRSHYLVQQVELALT